MFLVLRYISFTVCSKTRQFSIYKHCHLEPPFQVPILTLFNGTRKTKHINYLISSHHWPYAALWYWQSQRELKDLSWADSSLEFWIVILLLGFRVLGLGFWILGWGRAFVDQWSRIKFQPGPVIGIDWGVCPNIFFQGTDLLVSLPSEYQKISNVLHILCFDELSP